MAERYQLPRSCVPPTTRRKDYECAPSRGSEGGKTRCIRGARNMVAFQGGHPPFKGNSPPLHPQPSWAKSSPTRSKVLPLRHGGWVPRVVQDGQGQKKPNRRAGGTRNCPAVTSNPPLSPRPAGERADRHAGGMQPHQVSAPFRLQRIQHEGPGSHVMQPARRLLRARNYTATRATTAPPRLRNQYRDSRQPCV
jgi:hypothetical protein